MAFKRTRKVLSYDYAVSPTCALGPELFVGNLINGIVPGYPFDGAISISALSDRDLSSGGGLNHLLFPA
jgi:hypothetical protein